MLYLVYCIDKPNQVEKRISTYDAHKAYMADKPIDCLLSGPCVDEKSHEIPVGGFFLVDASNIEEVKAWNENDPFYKAGIWKSVQITPWLKRVDNLSSK